jgi:hypothetical protein
MAVHLAQMKALAALRQQLVVTGWAPAGFLPGLRQEPEGPAPLSLHDPLPQLLGSAASHGLLIGQIVFSSAFIGDYQLPNGIQVLRQVNACRSRWKPAWP